MSFAQQGNKKFKYNTADGGATYTDHHHSLFKASPWVVLKNVCNRQMTEGDIATVFSQFGEVIDVRFIRHGKSGGFLGRAFVKYDDCRSCILAADNMNSARLENLRHDQPHLLQWPHESTLKKVFLLATDELPLEVDHVDPRDVPRILHEQEDVSGRGPGVVEAYGEWYERVMIRGDDGEGKDGDGGGEDEDLLVEDTVGSSS